MRFVIYNEEYGAIAFLYCLCYIKRMSNEHIESNSNISKSELDKFRIFYEFITPQDKHSTHKASMRQVQRHSRQLIGK